MHCNYFPKKQYPNIAIKPTKSADVLLNWYQEVKVADWANFAEMKNTFNSADAVGNNLYVFNIKGNHYRIIARVTFNVRTMYIKFIGTHKEYNKVNLGNL